MKAILTFVLCLQVTLAFSIDKYAKGDELFVHAPSGLKLRSTPDGDAVVTVPFGSKLKVLADKIMNPSKMVDGLQGCWAKVDFNGKTGFIFDGYLSFLPTPKESCKDLKEYCQTAFNQLTPLLISSFTDCYSDEDGMGTSDSYTQVFKYKDKTIVYSSNSGYEWGEELVTITGISNEEAYLIATYIFREQIKKAGDYFKANNFPESVSPDAYTKYVQHPKTDCFKVQLNTDGCNEDLMINKRMRDNVVCIRLYGGC
ncbi:MAG: SH3 domain-containing protein [Sphingobacteriales bacterium JAD_PAG50586_3]|nr:MAG: SH3 domain-containing protein [Sphingobacteriales bacterium JAD_PAG50586_3]